MRQQPTCAVRHVDSRFRTDLPRILTLIQILLRMDDVLMKYFGVAVEVLEIGFDRVRFE